MTPQILGYLSQSDCNLEELLSALGQPIAPVTIEILDLIDRGRVRAYLLNHEVYYQIVKP